MYVLLNLKDEAMLQSVVQLLFSHGHRTLSIGETIENLCPTCEKSSAAADAPPPPPEFTCSTPIKQNSKPYLKRAYDNVSPIMANAPSSKYEEVSVKEEPSDEGNDEPDMTGDIEEDTDSFNLSQALELFDQTKQNEAKSGGKKTKHEEPFGELFQCQLCKKCISRHGQYANLLNHLSRHARLHASKKQYCCPKCGSSYTRRYLASAHIKEVHNDMSTEPHDYAHELREEYKSLLEICFPGAGHRRGKSSSAEYSSSVKTAIMSILDENDIFLPQSELSLNESVKRDVVEVHVGSDKATSVKEEPGDGPSPKSAKLDS
ncbi:unnamed protein product [Caenorhabditis bovis]|uniref:C2H2-type domain-containing protein n=1 Tax=Caenorhabditis bovis TaxID=2654633 RepID=A0A8S1ENQ1_9PELO|nr:unnamed protein product [Caenorhabditis bovis]